MPSSPSTMDHAFRTRVTRLQMGARVAHAWARGHVWAFCVGPVGRSGQYHGFHAKAESREVPMMEGQFFARAHGPRRWRRFLPKAIRGGSRRPPGGPGGSSNVPHPCIGSWLCHQWGRVWQAIAHGAGGQLDPGSESAELSVGGFPRKLDLGYEVIQPQTIDLD